MSVFSNTSLTQVNKSYDYSCKKIVSPIKVYLNKLSCHAPSNKFIMFPPCIITSLINTKLGYSSQLMVCISVCNATHTLTPTDPINPCFQRLTYEEKMARRLLGADNAATVLNTQDTEEEPVTQVRWLFVSDPHTWRGKRNHTHTLTHLKSYRHGNI